MFVTSEHGMIVQDAFSMLPDYSRFLGVHVPFFYLINSPEKRSKVSKNQFQFFSLSSTHGDKVRNMHWDQNSYEGHDKNPILNALNCELVATKNSSA